MNFHCETNSKNVLEGNMATLTLFSPYYHFIKALKQTRYIQTVQKS